MQAHRTILQTKGCSGLALRQNQGCSPTWATPPVASKCRRAAVCRVSVTPLATSSSGSDGRVVCLGEALFGVPSCCIQAASQQGPHTRLLRQFLLSADCLAKERGVPREQVSGWYAPFVLTGLPHPVGGAGAHCVLVTAGRPSQVARQLMSQPR